MGFYGSSKCSCEENYYFKKLAAVIFQSNNTDNGSAFYDQDFIAGLSQRFGGIFTPGKIQDLKGAGTLLMFGNDFEMAVPVAGFAVRQALSKGTIVFHFGYTNRSLTSPRAHGYIISPGSELALLNGLLYHLTDRLKKNRKISEIPGFRKVLGILRNLPVAQPVPWPAPRPSAGRLPEC